MPARGCGARKRRHKRSAVPGTAALCRDAARCSKLKAVPATSYRAKPATVRVEHARAWQRMLSGRRLDLLDPSPLDIEIEDIAHGLARVARWNGQTSGAHIYSVAQHCSWSKHWRAVACRGSTEADVSPCCCTMLRNM